MLSFDKATYLSLFIKIILSVKLSNSLSGSDVLLFLELIIQYSFLYNAFIEFIISLYTFLVISFARYKCYFIRVISFSKFVDVLPDFTCARSIVLVLLEIFYF